MATVRVNGVELYYEIHGSGEPLLLIMGLGANATAWDNQVPVFAEHHAVIAFDNRGAGRSEKPPGPYAMHQMAADTAGLMDELGVGSSHVFGMSMGGMVAQEYTLRHPERVRSLILGGTMPGGPHAITAGPHLVQQFVSLAGMPVEQAIITGMAMLYSEAFIEANRDRLMARALQYAPLMAPPHGLQAQIMAVMTFNAYDRLHEVKVPTLILTGTEDRIVPHANSKLLMDRIPGSRLIEFAGAGHGFLMERADEANAAVLDFLRPLRDITASAK